MQLRTLTTALAALTLFATIGVATAHAQDPEAGDTGQWQQPNNNGQQNGWGQPNGNGAQPPQGNGGNNGGNNGGWNNGGNNAQQPNGAGNTGNTGGGWSQDNEHAGAPHGGGGEEPAAPSGNDWSNDDNHTSVVHRVGIGFFGTADIPVQDTGPADAPGDLTPVLPSSGSPVPGNPRTITAPTIGVRYWINDLIGLDVALGVGFKNSSETMGRMGGGVGTDWGFAIHAGLPLALAHWKHFTFILAPELGFGVGGGDDGGNNTFSGFLFTIGAKLGGEIHFGFIGIPQLSLQAGISLALKYVSGSTISQTDTSGDSDHSYSRFTIGTSLDHQPWDIFLANISAIYYL